jgi:hypothetical protein
VTPGPLAHRSAMTALSFGDGVRPKLHQASQDVGPALAGIKRRGGVDGLGDIVGLGEEMTWSSVASVAVSTHPLHEIS